MVKQYQFMKKLLLLISLVLFSCSDEPEIILSPSGNIISYQLSKELNPSLSNDVEFSFNGEDTFTGTIDYVCDIESLVASYEFVGGSIQVNGELQTSGVSSNDYSNPISYEVFNSSNTNSRIFFIEILYLTDPIEISSFSFYKSLNSSLTSDLDLTFDGIDTFSGSVNYLSNIENLVASYEFTGGDVIVQDELQISAVSVNDFNQIVTYKVFNTLGNSFRLFYIDITYFTGLPILSIDTNNIPILSKDDYLEGFASIYGGFQFFDIDAKGMKIRGRGNSTWGAPKKPYQLKFNDKTPVLGMPKDKKWLLLAEYSDKSLIRNKISLDLGAMSLLDYTPQAEYAEVYLNDQYNGTYLISQKVEVKNNRLNLPDNGYLIEIDQDYRLDADDVFFQPTIFTQNFGSNIFAIKEPSVDFGDDEYTLIKDHINAFEAVLFGDNFKNSDTGYQAFIDMDSFIDWYLIQEIAKSVDAKWYSSIYFNYVPGEKIKMGPLWDFDLSYGNVDYADATYAEGFWIKDNPWYSRLFEDPYFENLVQERFMYFYDNTNLLLEKIDSYKNYLELAQEQNYQRWPTLGTYVWPNPVWFDTHAEEVGHLKSWLTNRMNWLYGEFN